jgi:hypothetical protein
MTAIDPRSRPQTLLTVLTVLTEMPAFSSGYRGGLTLSDACACSSAVLHFGGITCKNFRRSRRDYCQFSLGGPGRSVDVCQ